MRRFLPKSKFALSVLTLMTGTTIAQIIPIVLSPILTRLYTPSSFGDLAIYMAVITIAAIGATCRYEQAIILPKSNNESLNIVVLCLVLACSFSLICLIGIATFTETIINLIGGHKSRIWLYSIPFSIVITSAYQALYYWLNRNQCYRQLMIGKIVSSLTMVITQIILYNVSKDGLIFGFVLGQLMALIVLIVQAKLFLNSHDEEILINSANIKKQAIRYIRFPQFLLVGHMLNAASGYVPIILLSTFFGTAASGFYSLTSRAIALPMSLIGSAMADVFRERASVDYLRDGNCSHLFIRTFKKLLIFSIIPSLACLVLSPTLFPAIFGKEWAISGIYAQLLTPMLFFQFITIPLCSMFIIAEKQHLDLAWQVVRMVLAVASILIGFTYYLDDKVAIFLFSISFSILYAASGIMGYQFSLGEKVKKA